jgi:hypothetical protein
VETERVGIDAARLHVVTDEEAKQLFADLLGRGVAWTSELMRYRTTSDWQEDWVIEVGNWLARARSLGFLDSVLGRIQPQRGARGLRDADDPVHRTVNQELAQAMTVHYLIGTGWHFGAYEPTDGALRRDRTPADVDLQAQPPSGPGVVDLQVKASGAPGHHDSVADRHILEGVNYAMEQLPDPPLGCALVVVTAQRGFWLAAETHVLEHLIGSTSGYPDERVLLHDDAHGALKTAEHVSGIVMLDYRRTLDGHDYGCSFLMNPWACYPADPSWFPHARVLSFRDGEFSWIRGDPYTTSFPTGTRLAPGAPGDAL